MAKNEMTAGAEHVLAHGTARTRSFAKSAQDKAAGGEGKKDGAEGKKGKGKKRLRRMEIEPAQNGGYVVKHVHHPSEDPMQPGPGHEDETYALGDNQALHDHIDQHLGAGEEQEPAGEQGAEEAMAEHAQGGEGGAAGASAG